MITFVEMNHVVCKNTYNSSLMHTKKKLEILAASKHELFVHVYGFFLVLYSQLSEVFSQTS